MKNLIYALFIVVILVEGSITSVPIVMLFLILYAVFTRSDNAFILAFIAGILIDTITLRHIGVSSILYLSVMFVVLLYERKFEIGSIYFVAFASFISSIIYLVAVGANQLFQQALICVILSIAFFVFINKFSTPKLKIY